MPTLATLPPSPLTLCLLGTGNMGLPMARRLAQAGYPMRVWNRTQAKAEVLAADGAVICATPRQACSGADITLSLLENGDVVEQVLFGLGAASGHVHGINQLFQEQGHAHVGAFGGHHAGNGNDDAPLVLPQIGQQAGNGAPVAGAVAGRTGIKGWGHRRELGVLR